MRVLGPVGGSDNGVPGAVGTWVVGTVGVTVVGLVGGDEMGDVPGGVGTKVVGIVGAELGTSEWLESVGLKETFCGFEGAKLVAACVGRAVSFRGVGRRDRVGWPV